MKRKATIGIILLFFFPFIGQTKTITLNEDTLFSSLLAPPTNDECVNATTLTVNQNYLCTNVAAGTLAEATASGGASFCSSNTKANEDVWYKFIATNTSHKIELLNIAGSETDLYHMVYDGGVGGTCPTTEAPIHCTTSNSSEQTDLAIGNTYFVRIFTDSTVPGANTTFNVCVGTTPTVAPDNDDCANAEAIGSFPFNGMYDATASTNNAGFINSSGCIPMNDGVWYTIMGNGGDITVTVTPTAWDAGIVVYEGNCGALSCVEDTNVGGSGIVEALTFNSIASTVYYINIAYPSGSVNQPEGVFDLAVTTSTLSIDEIVAKGFYYYPNPVQNVLKMSAKESIDQISIFSLMGREIKRADNSDLNAEIDMSNLAQGTYFVRVVVGDSSGSFKVIKN